MLERNMFCRWDIEPGHGEPAHGYFRRLVLLHGVESVRTFNIWNDIETDVVDPARSLRIIENHPLPEAWKARLRNATPIKRGNYVHVGTECFGTVQLSFRPRRWCRGCIAEAAYHRAWWDLVCLTRCPFHDQALVTSDVDGHQVFWRWPGFQFSKEGSALGVAAPRQVPSPCLAGYVLGRLGFHDRLQVPMLDGARLREGIELCQLIGKLLSNPYHAITPEDRDTDAEAGYAVIGGGLVATTEAFRRWLRTYHPHGLDNASLDEAYGWLPNRIAELRDTGLRELLRRLLREARAAEGSRLAREVTADDFETEYVTIKEVARRTGFDSKGVTLVAEELGLLQRARVREGIPAHSVRKIEGFAHSLLGPEETAAMLGIHSDALRHFVHAGMLRVWPGLGNGRGCNKYDRKRVEDILRKIDELPVHGVPEYGLTFDIFRKRNKIVPGKLAIDVLSGKYVVAAKRAAATGFKKIVLETDTLHRGIPFVRPPDSVNMAEAQAILNLSHVSVASLLDKGLLRAIERKRFLVAFDRQEIETFQADYAKISDFSPGLDMHPTLIFRKLRSAGVDLVLEGNFNGRRTESVVRRSDVMRVFGTADDPSALDDEEFVAFWKAFVRRCRASLKTFPMPDRLPAAGQRCWQNSSVFSAVFRFDAATRFLTIRTATYGGPREQHEFPISDEAIPETIIRMLVRNIDAGFAYSKARGREKQSNAHSSAVGGTRP